MKILYAGDSSVGGAANYLLGVLKLLHARVRHIPPSVTMTPQVLSQRYDAIILSDFSCARTPTVTQRLITQHVRSGTGLFMVGGWGSFAGPLGGWQGSLIDTLLPVSCLRRDDRLHLPGGALVVPVHSHPMLRSISFAHPPSICGLNQVRPKPRSLVLLAARRLTTRSRFTRDSLRIALDPREHPLLVIDAHPRRRIAALTTDLAPHWCGGLLDWGTRRISLPVTTGIRVEVGDRYAQFVSRVMAWLVQMRGSARVTA